MALTVRAKVGLIRHQPALGRVLEMDQRLYQSYVTCMPCHSTLKRTIFAQDASIVITTMKIYSNNNDDNDNRNIYAG